MSNELFKSYSYDLENNKVPIAIVLPSEQEVVVGSIVKLDGRSSIDPENNGLTYTWSFTQVPIGSQVEQFGFTNLEDDGSIVGFAPDITGTYKVQLIVSDNSLPSAPAEAVVECRVILVAHHQGYVPDASFIWNYLSDFWTLVPDKKRFETFWSAAIQIAASEQLKLYQYQYNKSIRDIQDTIQKRWISVSPVIELDRSSTTFVLADDAAGLTASTLVLNPISGTSEAVDNSYSNSVTVPISEYNFLTTPYGKSVSKLRLLHLSNRSYSMSRANGVTKASNYGVDGESSGVNTFIGSEFTEEMVGATLRILDHSGSPSIIGDYKIISYVSPSEITVEVPNEVIWAPHSNIEYSVLPSSITHSTFFSDQVQIPTGEDNQSWRFSSTLISSTLNFEELGVQPGDLLEVELTRTDTDAVTNFFVQIVSVDRNKAGFVLNLEDLVGGQAAGGLTDDIQVTIAADLGVTGLATLSDASLHYTLEAELIRNEVTSAFFKRTYFEEELSPDNEIDIGPFSIKARPVQIIRNKKILIDPDIQSIPILQEYIKQPQIAKQNGKILFVGDLEQKELSREPYLLSENLDYIIDDESSIFGVCTIEQGVDEITISSGDLVDRSVQEGDTITVNVGIITNKFDIRKILSPDKIRVFPVPTISSSGASFTITRRLEGKYLRFVNGVFSKTRPAPERLWAEVAYLDNSKAVENNFGVLVGLRKEDLDRVGASMPYKSAVAGLMYALSRGPTISNLELSAKILIGLPFSQTRGIIKEINPKFRLREDGSPKFGRILVDALDFNGDRLGITHIYLYPLGAQIKDSITGEWVAAVPDFSGLAINPETGEEYKVGDFIDQFAPLSKGVIVEEYLSSPNWHERLIAQGNIESQLQKYHSFQVVLNSDLLTTTDVGIVASFMKKVKAHYLRMSAAILKSLQDTVDPEDYITFGRLLTFFDNEDLGTPSAFKLDESDDNLSYISIDGVFYTRYHHGDDLVTTKDSSNVSSVSGGFIDVRPEFIESWDPPHLRPGDLLAIESGNNVGKYTISSVTSDSELAVELDGRNFETSSNQKFSIFRPIKNPIWRGLADIVSSSQSVILYENDASPAGIGSAGVSVGDTLVFYSSGLNPSVSKQYTIVKVTPSGTNPEIVLDRAISESTGLYNAFVVREGLIPRGVITPYGETTPEFYASTVSGSFYVNFIDTVGGSNSWLNVALIRPGDIIRISGIPYEVQRLEIGSRRAFVLPQLLVSISNQQIDLELRPDRASTVAGIDFLNRTPNDYVELAIEDIIGTVNTINGSSDVELTTESFLNLLIKPGDRLILLEGGDSLIDVGHGPGVFPIREIMGASTARLMDTLTSTGSFRYRLQRKIPNEG